MASSIPNDYIQKLNFVKRFKILVPAYSAVTRRFEFSGSSAHFLLPEF